MDTIAYVADSLEQERTNCQGLEYWDIYIEDILSQLGVSAKRIEPPDLSNAALAGVEILFLGRSGLSADARSAIHEWVRDGGTLIGFLSDGLAETFGVEEVATLPHGDLYKPSARLDFLAHPLDDGIHSPHHPDKPLLIFSELKRVIPRSAVPLASFRETRSPAITLNYLGKGKAVYFAFSLPKTLWLIHQGRPCTVDTEGDGHFRTGDMNITRDDTDTAVLYADEFIFLLERIVATCGLPMIEALPPSNGTVPQAVFFWGGDDEGAPELQLKSSRWMKERSLPYHINVMWMNGRFALKPAEADEIRANGHEVSLHYNFWWERLRHFTRQDLLQQAADFKRTFGFSQEVSVMHCIRWSGWTDTARWLAEAGNTGDNSFFPKRYPPMNPANSLGFAFGTAFPFFFRDDWRYGNARIPLVEVTINAYETGYSGDKTTPDLTCKVVDIALYYGLCMNMFYHPICIMGSRSCQQAIDNALRFIAESGTRVRHMGPDALVRWWIARESSAIVAKRDGKHVQVRVNADHPDGLILKLPDGAIPAPHLPLQQLKRAGKRWNCVVLPHGETELSYMTT